jgi:hypothetical protein
MAAKLALLLSFCIFINYTLGEDALFLNDDTFEHDTQASTGATTGDWLVLFCDKSTHKDCRQIMPLWNDLADRLTGRASVAFLLRVESTIATFLRFRIMKETELPLILLFKRGKYYTYQSKEWEQEKLIKFVLEGDLDQEGAPVPREITIWDEMQIFAGNFKTELIKELKEVSNWDGEEGISWSGIAMVSFGPILMTIFICVAIMFKDEPVKKPEVKKEVKKEGKK